MTPAPPAESDLPAGIPGRARRPGANPFRSDCVDALNYRASGQESLTQIEARVRAGHFRGAIVGPHGHGKSTLMDQLAELPLPPDLCGSRRLQVTADGSNRAEVRAALQQTDNTVLWIDGYDLLPMRLRWAARRRRHVVVTSHEDTALPTLAQCETSPALLSQLVEQLSPAVRSHLENLQIAELYARHRGNVREALRELYDRFADGEFVTTASSV